MKKFMLLGWIAMALGGAIAARAQTNTLVGSLPITGTVQLDGNEVSSGIRIEVRSVTGEPVQTVFTRMGGEFQVSFVPYGTYIVSANLPGYEPVEKVVQASPGAEQHVWLYLKKTRPEPDTAPNQRSAVSVHELSIPGKAHKEYQNGLKLLAKNDAAGSLDHFKRAIDAFPDYYEAYYQMALARIALGQKDDAEQALRKSIELSVEKFSPSRVTLALLLCERQQYGEAEGLMREELRRNPNSWTAHFVLARVMLATNRLQEAGTNAHAALQHKPDSALAHLLMADIQVRTHNYDTAVHEIDTYLMLEGNTPLSEQVRKFRSRIEQLAGSQTAGGKVEQAAESPLSSSQRKSPE